MKLVNRDAAANTFKINNVGTKNVYINFNANPGSSVPASLTVPPGQTREVNVERNWGGAFFAGLQMGNPANNKIEANFQGFDGTTYFDVDVEKGFSVPVVCLLGDGVVTSGCKIDKLPECPAAQRLTDASGATVACSNPQTAESIAMMRAGCPDMYVVWDDPQTRAGKSNIISCDIGVAQSNLAAAPIVAAATQAFTPVVSTPIPVPVAVASAQSQVAPKPAVVTQTKTIMAPVTSTVRAKPALAQLSDTGAVRIPVAGNLVPRSLHDAGRLSASSGAHVNAALSPTALLLGVLGAYVGKKLFAA